MIPKHIKQEAKKYNTIKELDERIALCVSHQAIIPAEFELWCYLFNKRERIISRGGV